MNVPAQPRLLLGEQLLSTGHLTVDQLRIGLQEQRCNGKLLGQTLVRLGFISEAVLRDALAESWGIQSIDLACVEAEPSALRLLPKEVARRLQILPLAVNEQAGKLVAAIAHPNNLALIDQLQHQLRAPFILELRIATESDIARAIDRHYGSELSIDGILHEMETGETDWRPVTGNPAESSQPVIRLIDALLADAVNRDASDLHFEPEQGFVRIRYRIDGVLQPVRALHHTCWPAMIVRLKVMANLNIAETRTPQDGRFSFSLAGRELDFRVSVLPTTWGENIVLRILDRHHGLIPLDELGLTENHLRLLQLMIARPEGILLVTGPTGSGKTTTLYSILSHINSTAINIMTLEDPVEYPIQVVRQTSISEMAKMDFVSGIRAILRQDPDVILVGEIRDAETAGMAFRAAMTGHQVYSTLHTHSAIGAIPRLLDMGILPDIMAGNIIGIIAQRLVRRLCVHCREPYDADRLERQLLGLPEQGEPARIFRARGCRHCAELGYRNRLAIMEILKMGPELDELLARRATSREILGQALEHGFRPLADDACRRVLTGETSLAEITRVVDLTQRVR